MYLPLSFKTGIVFCHVERKVALKIVRNTCRYFQNYPWSISGNWAMRASFLYEMHVPATL